MSEFFHAVFNHTFMMNALLTGLLAGVACGLIGTYVVTRRITYIAGGIAHSVLGGMGAARYLTVVHGWSIPPLLGAVVAALAAAVTIGIVSLHTREREDTVIGAIWAIGMSAGILFIANTPGYNVDLMSYLFGNILMVSRGDLLLIAGLDVLVVGVSFVFFNQLQAVCFDEEFARVRGIPVEFFYLLLLALTAAGHDPQHCVHNGRARGKLRSGSAGRGDYYHGRRYYLPACSRCPSCIRIDPVIIVTIDQTIFSCDRTDDSG